jgi:hypothetical protein
VNRQMPHVMLSVCFVLGWVVYCSTMVQIRVAVGKGTGFALACRLCAHSTSCIILSLVFEGLAMGHHMYSSKVYQYGHTWCVHYFVLRLPGLGFAEHT